MATWTTQRADTLRITMAPVGRLVLTAGLAIAFFIPAWLDWEGGSSRSPESLVWYVAAIVVTGLVASPWRRLVVDRANQSVIVASRRLLVARTDRRPLPELAGAALVDRFRIGPFALCALRLRFREKSYTIPLGWRWRDRLDAERRRAIRALGEFVPVTDETSPQCLDAVPAGGRTFQVSLRRVLLATGLVGVVLAAGRVLAWKIDDAEGPVTAFVACVSVAVALAYRPGTAVARRMAPSLFAMYAPFAWLVLELPPWGHISGLFQGLPWFPSLWMIFIPAARTSHEAMPWIALGIVLLELGAAWGCACRGWKWSLPCTMALLALSALASFVLNAGIRV